MGSCMAAYWMLIMVTIVSVTGKPVNTMRTQKRQSDQRVAELETLLALQKYGAHHFLRSQSGDGAGSYFPVYGVIDFNKIGRKKKSSPPIQIQDQAEDDFQNWVLSPSSSWTPSSSSTNPSSDMIRIKSPRNSSKVWKASFNPILTDIATLEDDNDDN